MPDVSYLAIVVAAAAAFVLSSVYYVGFGGALAGLHEAYADPGRTPPWKVLVEVLRNLVLAVVLAGLTDQADIDGWGEAALLGVVAWIGFPIVLWTGAVIWENVQPKLAAIHAGDWLLKLVLVAVIVGTWG